MGLEFIIRSNLTFGGSNGIEGNQHKSTPAETLEAHHKLSTLHWGSEITGTHSIQSSPPLWCSGVALMVICCLFFPFLHSGDFFGLLKAAKSCSVTRKSIICYLCLRTQCPPQLFAYVSFPSIAELEFAQTRKDAPFHCYWVPVFKREEWQGDGRAHVRMIYDPLGVCRDCVYARP